MNALGSLPTDGDSGTMVSHPETELEQSIRAATTGHEERTGGRRDENWPDWYAEYMVREQSGEELPK